MRYSCVIGALFLAGALCAQQSSQSSSYGYDINGRRLSTGSASGTRGDSGQTTTESSRTLNGRSAPLEHVEEKVLSEGPDGRIIERTVQRYGQDGRPGQKERIRIEEKRRPDGGATVRQTVYRTDINGRYALQEQSVTDTTVSGDVTNSSTVVERPNINGSLDVVERQTSTETKREDGLTRNSSTWRANGSGGLIEQERSVTEVREAGEQQTETTTVYNTARGEMQFARQTVTTTEKQADGSETKQVSIYGNAAMGRSIVGSDRKPVLREQQLIERTVGADGSVAESFQVRRASLADSNRMEPYTRVSETLCTGPACQTEAESEATVPVEEVPEPEPVPVEVAEVETVPIEIVGEEAVSPEPGEGGAAEPQPQRTEEPKPQAPGRPVPPPPPAGPDM